MNDPVFRTCVRACAPTYAPNAASGCLPKSHPGSTGILPKSFDGYFGKRTTEARRATVDSASRKSLSRDRRCLRVDLPSRARGVPQEIFKTIDEVCTRQDLSPKEVLQRCVAIAILNIHDSPTFRSQPHHVRKPNLRMI